VTETPWIKPLSIEFQAPLFIRIVLGLATLSDFAPSDERMCKHSYSICVSGSIYRTKWRLSRRRAFRDVSLAIRLLRARGIDEALDRCDLTFVPDDGAAGDTVA
jgi:hypothetical protein